jgi:MFS family permease
MSALIFRPFFGKMLDDKGRRIVLIIGLCLFGVSTLLLIVSANVFFIFALRFFQGIGLSAYSTALGTILSDVVPAERLSEGVGYFGISGTIAMAMGPTLALYLSDRFSYETAYIVAFVVTMLSVFFGSMIRYEGTFHAKNKRLISQNTSGKGFIEKTAIRPCIVLIFIVFAISSVFSFITIFSQERNIDNIGLFFTVYALSMILSRLVTGKAADRFGYVKVLMPAIAMTFMLFIILAFAYSLPAVLVAAVFYGVGYGTVQPIMNTIIIRFSPPERRGAANATYYATLDTGIGIGALIWGLVSERADFTVVFLSSAFCVAIGVVAYFLILHKSLKENN